MRWKPCGCMHSAASYETYLAEQNSNRAGYQMHAHGERTLKSGRSQGLMRCFWAGSAQLRCSVNAPVAARAPRWPGGRWLTPARTAPSPLRTPAPAPATSTINTMFHMASKRVCGVYPHCLRRKLATPEPCKTSRQMSCTSTRSLIQRHALSCTSTRSLIQRHASMLTTQDMLWESFNALFTLETWAPP